MTYTVMAQSGVSQVWTVFCIVDDHSGFVAQAAETGSKNPGQAFNLSITNAKDANGSDLSGLINVIVNSSIDGQVYNGEVTFTNGEAVVPVILEGVGSHTLTVSITGVNESETVNVTVVGSGGGPGAGIGGGGGGGTGTVPGTGNSGSGNTGTETPATPTFQANISGGLTSSTSIPITVNTDTGSATANLGDLGAELVAGTNRAVITVPVIPGVNSYALGLPAQSLTGSSGDGALTFSTDAGSITIPSGMLAGMPGTEGKKAGITIGQGDKSGLPDEVKAAVGDRPVVQLTLTLDGKQAEWNNPSAPVTVSIPYTPTAAELADPEHIVVWYIDGSGNVVSVPNGRYDPTTGTVTFITTHFSHYAVAYVHKTFGDLGGVEWARKPIEVMASKGIITGTGANSFSPAANITRADYLVLLIKTLGLTAEFDDNFDDVEPGAYYYEAVGIAKKLGIAAGIGNNRFNPKENISRQDMMVLTARVLEKYKGLKAAGGSAVLDKFSDKGDIAGYAINSIAILVKEGLIAGSGDRLNPRANTTRAEASVFLYRIYNKY